MNVKRVKDGQFKHWSVADFDKEIAAYRRHLAMGLAQKPILPHCENWASHLDRLVLARASLVDNV